MAVLGAVLVGCDAYSRALELAPNSRRLSSRGAASLVRWWPRAQQGGGYRRVMAVRTLQAAAQSRLQRPLGPNTVSFRWGVGRAAGIAGDVGALRASHAIGACRGLAMASAGLGRCMLQRGDWGYLSSGGSLRSGAEGDKLTPMSPKMSD